MNSPNHASFHWLGADTPCLDAPHIYHCGHTVIGCYGGTKEAGAKKNEDAALVWAASDGSWVFTALLDAHGSAESANLVMNRIAEMEDTVSQMLSDDTAATPPFWALGERVVAHLTDEQFRLACAAVRGETALLLCGQKGEYLWWLSVGDIPVYALHTEFMRLGQFALNQRMFFEWIGQVNTFSLPIPCYSTGVRQLRPGSTRVLLTTDGLLECGSRPFESPRALYEFFLPSAPAEGDREIASALRKALDRVSKERGRDSATLVAWDVDLPESQETMHPSA